jgi:hypothetical protein
MIHLLNQAYPDFIDELTMEKGNEQTIKNYE